MTFMINRVTLREIHMNLREPFQISSGATSTRRILLLELEGADGCIAWSGYSSMLFRQAQDLGHLRLDWHCFDVL